MRWARLLDICMVSTAPRRAQMAFTACAAEPVRPAPASDTDVDKRDSSRSSVSIKC